MTRSTHTYALMSITPQAYNEIRQKLLDAGYEHAVNDQGELDMHGIGLIYDKESLNVQGSPEQADSV